MSKLSIIIPVFNEDQTILQLIKTVEDVQLATIEKEIIIIDDHSTDKTPKLLQSLKDKYKIVFKDKNEGKGSSVHLGLKQATGDYVIIQDADLEYDPNDYRVVLEPLLSGRAEVVYGSRFIGDRPHRVLYFWHAVGNKFLTLFSNVFTNLNLTDMETCYKIFTAPVAKYLSKNLTSKRFGLEPEITALVAKGHFQIYEVGISYFGRTYKEGKKINWRDGLAALWHIIKFNLFTKYDS